MTHSNVTASEDAFSTVAFPTTHSVLISMRGLTPIANSFDVSAYLGISHALLVRELERCLKEDADWEAEVQLALPNAQSDCEARPQVTYEMTIVAVDEATRVFTGKAVNKRRSGFVAVMDAAEDAVSHLWVPLHS